MNITEHEMRGLITGKAMPADIFVGESLAAYLVRKFTNLHAERDALAAENANIKASVEMHAAGFKICPACSHQDECETDDVVWMVREATPATDAYLNSVRAEGVEALTKILQVMIEAGDFSGDEVGAIAGAIDAGNYHAAQLRAGKDGE